MRLLPVGGRPALTAPALAVPAVPGPPLTGPALARPPLAAPLRPGPPLTAPPLPGPGVRGPGRVRPPLAGPAVAAPTLPVPEPALPRRAVGRRGRPRLRVPRVAEDVLLAGELRRAVVEVHAAPSRFERPGAAGEREVLATVAVAADALTEGLEATERTGVAVETEQRRERRRLEGRHRAHQHVLDLVGRGVRVAVEEVGREARDDRGRLRRAGAPREAVTDHALGVVGVDVRARHPQARDVHAGSEHVGFPLGRARVGEVGRRPVARAEAVV